MDSQEWAEQLRVLLNSYRLVPTVSVKMARTILEAHGWDDVDVGLTDDFDWAFITEDYETIATLDENGEVDSQQLVDWLGY